MADGATLKLDNQKNGWRGVCIYHEANGEPWNCAVKALSHRFAHIHNLVKGSSGWRTYLSAYYVNSIWYNVSDNNMRVNLKWAAKMLDYLDNKGIPIECIDTYSLRMGGTNTLGLSGYSDCQIQKWGNGAGPRSGSTFGRN